MSVASAGMDIWNKKFEDYHKNIHKFEGYFVNRLPYSILERISDTVEKAWDKYQVSAARVAPKAENAKAFIATISAERSQIKLESFLKMDKENNSHDIENCLTQNKSLIQERLNADMDESKGFMGDISEETLIDLSQQIGASQMNWKLLGDGLGYTNSQCRCFTAPLFMLENWIKQNRAATVARFYFEAKQLNMKSICHYLNAIPMEGTPKIKPVQELLVYHTNVTRYHLIRLKEILAEKRINLSWEAVAKKECDFFLGCNKDSPFDALWKDSKLTLSNFMQFLEKTPHLAPVLEQFKEEIKTGMFEHKSPGGISREQVKYLANSVAKLKIDQGSSVQHRFTWGPIDIHVLKEVVFPDLHLGGPLSFEGFLTLYWEDPNLGANLSLNQFCQKMIEILRNGKKD